MVRQPCLTFFVQHGWRSHFVLLGNHQLRTPVHRTHAHTYFLLCVSRSPLRRSGSSHAVMRRYIRTMCSAHGYFPPLYVALPGFARSAAVSSLVALVSSVFGFRSPAHGMQWCVPSAVGVVCTAECDGPSFSFGPRRGIQPGAMERRRKKVKTTDETTKWKEKTMNSSTPSRPLRKTSSLCAGHNR